MQKQYKVNNNITATEIRVISDDGKQIGVLPRAEAIDYAVGQGFDLVLVGEGAKPPVAKVIDFKKFLYQEQKKEQEAKKSQKVSGLKEVMVGGPFTEPGLVGTRILQARKHLEKGYNIKVWIKFTGRQLSKGDFGHKIFARFTEELKDIAILDKPAHFEGRRLIGSYRPI